MIELPSDLAEVLKVVQSNQHGADIAFPNGDEDLLAELASAWEAWNTAAESRFRSIVESAKQARANMSGEAADTFQQYLEKYAGRDDSHVATTLDAGVSIAQSLRGATQAVTRTKTEMVRELQYAKEYIDSHPAGKHDDVAQSEGVKQAATMYHSYVGQVGANVDSMLRQNAGDVERMTGAGKVCTLHGSGDGSGNAGGAVSGRLPGGRPGPLGTTTTSGAPASPNLGLDSAPASVGAVADPGAAAVAGGGLDAGGLGPQGAGGGPGGFGAGGAGLGGLGGFGAGGDGHRGAGGAHGVGAVGGPDGVGGAGGAGRSGSGWGGESGRQTFGGLQPFQPQKYGDPAVGAGCYGESGQPVFRPLTARAPGLDLAGLPGAAGGGGVGPTGSGGLTPWGGGGVGGGSAHFGGAGGGGLSLGGGGLGAAALGALGGGGLSSGGALGGGGLSGGGALGRGGLSGGGALGRGMSTTGAAGAVSGMSGRSGGGLAAGRATAGVAGSGVGGTTASGRPAGMAGGMGGGHAMGGAAGGAGGKRGGSKFVRPTRFGADLAAEDEEVLTDSGVLGSATGERTGDRQWRRMRRRWLDAARTDAPPAERTAAAAHDAAQPPATENTLLTQLASALLGPDTEAGGTGAAESAGSSDAGRAAEASAPSSEESYLDRARSVAARRGRPDEPESSAPTDPTGTPAAGAAAPKATEPSPIREEGGYQVPSPFLREALAKLASSGAFANADGSAKPSAAGGAAGR